MSSYEDFLRQYEPKDLDLLLFHGRSWWFSKLLEWAIPSRYSHCALIIQIPNPAFTDPTLEPGFYTLESGEESFPDSEDGRRKFGVQMVPLQSVWKDWDSSLYYRRLRCERSPEGFYEKLQKLSWSTHNLPYDTTVWDWIRAKFRWFEGTGTQRKDRFWCSALVAYIYTEVGFLPPDTPWTLLSPQALGTEPGRSPVLEFQNCTLEKEVCVHS